MTRCHGPEPLTPVPATAPTQDSLSTALLGRVIVRELFDLDGVGRAFTRRPQNLLVERLIRIDLQQLDHTVFIALIEYVTRRQHAQSGTNAEVLISRDAQLEVVFRHASI